MVEVLPSLKIQDKLRDLSRYQRDIMSTRFPTKYKYKFLKDAVNNTTEDIRYLLAKVKKAYYKKGILEDIDVKLELLRDYVRECIEDKNISMGIKGAHYWMDLIDEIGAIVGGWLIKVKQEPQYAKNTIKGMSSLISEEDISERDI